MENLFLMSLNDVDARRNVRFLALCSRNRINLFLVFSGVPRVYPIVEFIRLRAGYTEFHEISSTENRERAI